MSSGEPLFHRSYFGYFPSRFAMQSSVYQTEIKKEDDLSLEQTCPILCSECHNVTHIRKINCNGKVTNTSCLTLSFLFVTKTIEYGETVYNQISDPFNKSCNFFDLFKKIKREHVQCFHRERVHQNFVELNIILNIAP
jgi:hypothetical protein